MSRRSAVVRRLATLLTALALAVGVTAGLTPAATANPPSDDPRVQQAAGWLARQLEANGYVMPGYTGQPGTADIGLTIDALFVLVAAGVGRDAVDEIADRLEEDSWALYLQNQSTQNLGAFAKVALALQIAGRDPEHYTGGGAQQIDLIQMIRDSQQASGRFGTQTNHFGQTLAVLALARTSGGVPSAATGYLEALQCTTPTSPNYGGIGFTTANPCGSVDGDATGFVLSGLLAGGRDAGSPSVQLALDWMEAHQKDDGSFTPSWSPGLGNTNSTGLVANAARQLGTPQALAIADAGRGFMESLQVDCNALFNGSPDDPAAGAGFARSWMGAIGYSRTAYDTAVSGGIPSLQTDQWRRASAQAALGLGDLPGFSELTLTGMAADVPEIDDCTPDPEPDTTGPDLRISGIAATSYLHHGRPVLGWTATPTGSPVTSVVARLDGRPVVRGAVDLWRIPLGTHTLVVTATDAAGNHSTAQVRFRVTTSTKAVKKLVKRFAAEKSMSAATRRNLVTNLDAAIRAEKRGARKPAAAAVKKAIKAAGKVSGAQQRKVLRADLRAVVAGLR
ncbi:hypothetical protein [Pimelobacter simplex]|uniref:hypothetical protein n=1 Tax=Nocardioides simplex TaxID=2045 RepID=UPI003AAE975A